MRIMKRWLALMLTASMALSDCGGITVFAAENDIAAETPVSGNDEGSLFAGEDENALSLEVSPEEELISESETEKSENSNVLPENADEATVSETDPVQDQETESPTIHIGWIKAGEDLPYPDDSGFIYDLPVSFGNLDSVVLFADYNIDEILGKEEQGTLVWSILRGGRGMEEGSASLVNEEDDWIGFEVVSGSPYFTMTENEDEESVYYKTVELAARGADVDSDIDADTDAARDTLRNADVDAVEDIGMDTDIDAGTDAVEDSDIDVVENGAYNYYIRAAYYLGTGEERNEAFYAAATVPFLPNEDVEVNETQDGTLDAGDADADETQDGTLGAEDADADETQDGVLGAEDADETIDGGLLLEDGDIDKSLEDTDEASGLSESDDTQQDSDKHITDLKLTTADGWWYVENIGMNPGETKQLIPKVAPAEIPVENLTIVWKSSNDNVASVSENGEIKAKAEGLAQITAQCDGITAAAKVEVVQAQTSKLLDLSGDIWVAGFKKESEDFVYSGQKITQDVRVYHKETLLKEKTDYAISYKNNVNAADYNALKAPSLTITMKGQYSGSVTLYYTIKPVDINDINVYNPGSGETGTENPGGGEAVTENPDVGENNQSGYEQAVAYSKSLKIPTPVLTFGKTKLKAGKDFVCDYTELPSNYKNGDAYKAGEAYNYTVNGIGNFTGSFQMQLVVIKDKNFSFDSAAVTLLQKQYEYHGTALAKSDVTIQEVKLNKKALDKSLYDYEVCAKAVEGACVMVYPTEAGKNAGYRGCKRVELKLIGDRNIGNAASGENWKEKITFSQKTVNEKGGIFQDKTGVLTFGTGENKETLTEGEDYTVKYSNAQKAGMVTATFTGKGRYKGTLKKKYEITPNSDKANLTLIWKNVTKGEGGALEIAYQKGGAVPEFTLKDQDNNALKNKTDYTVKLANNKTPGTSMSCEIGGKGNYKGYKETVQIRVTNGDISKGTISIPDKPYSTKQDAWKSKVVIKDVNGKKLAAGKDYVNEPVYDNAGSASPAVGSSVNVTVRGMGCYEGTEITGSYRIYKNSISKLKITVDAKEYTGEEIKLSDSDIHVYATSADAKKKNELTEYCYKIDEYKNNIKAGTAKVTLRGMGNYGGTKTCSFKIQKKMYLVNRVKGITLNKTQLSLSLSETDETKKTLTAQITPNNASNTTVVWSSSNSNIAEVRTGTINGATITGIITAKKEGSVTITATTQDGGKKAQCKLQIVNAPILKEAGKTIEAAVGDTYQLEFEHPESQEVSLNGIEWESSNPDVVSVDKKGLLTMKKIGAAVIKVYACKRNYVQQCYIVVKGGEEEPIPENYLAFNQKPGSADDTDRLRNCVDNAYYGGYEGVYIPAGVYWIDAIKSVYMHSNLNLVMSPGALIMAIPNSSKNDFNIIWLYNLENVTISGGTFVGERNEHGSTNSEGGMGIGVYGCTNVHIDNVDVSQCWGDGIYLGETIKADGSKSCRDIYINNCNVHHNRRNNLSITAADYVYIDNCQFNYAKGTDPQYGIDIETNNKNNPCDYITIKNSKFIGNAKASMGIENPANHIRLEDCTLDGRFRNVHGKDVVLCRTTVKGVDDFNGGVKIEK